MEDISVCHLHLMGRILTLGQSLMLLLPPLEKADVSVRRKARLFKVNIYESQKLSDFYVDHLIFGQYQDKNKG